MGEDLECLCQIMRTVGPKLDHEKAKVTRQNLPKIFLASLVRSLLIDTFVFQSLMDQYFGRMRSLTCSKELPARIRFLLQNTVELRANRWIPRKALSDAGPKTIGQVRQEAVKVSLVYISNDATSTNMNSFWLSAAGFGCFYSSSKRFDEKWLLHGHLVPSFKNQVWQGDLWWTGWYVWTNAWYALANAPTLNFQQTIAEVCLTVMSCILLGCGIGTGPGVIQDHYSPTMGRHRTNPHYDHVVNGSGLHQAQYDSGNKSFIKQNQVKRNNKV